ncbi:hypothetical protein ABZ023_31975 [Streptomyces sp. NPDC006367]|uniref:hypothetical protein n=1 Tax=unclassified Streptomyces TaxID=2593676 RepID=UPI0033A76CBD
MTATSTALDAPAPSGTGVPLRNNRSFPTHWSGEAVTLAGASVHGAALSVAAVLEPDASPGQVPLLAAAAPAFILALPAGVADAHRPKKRIMVGADPAAAVVMSVVPVCWAAGVLSGPDGWVPGPARAVDAYRAVNPALPAGDLVAAPLSGPAAVPQCWGAYGRARNEAAGAPEGSRGGAP